MLLALVALPAASGCQATHLAYVHNAVLGVDIGASTNEGQVKLVIGYDRKTFAIVPRRNDSPDSDAMSVAAASRVQVAGLSTDKFGHVVATGAPAVRLAKNPSNLGTFVDALFGDTAAPAPAPAGTGATGGAGAAGGGQ